jgi:hypothetical protein
MFRPDFLLNDEEWVIWLLVVEFHGQASPQQIIERTHLDLDQVDEVIRNLDRIRAIRIVTIPGKFPPENIRSIGLRKTGIALYEDLQQRDK